MVVCVLVVVKIGWVVKFCCDWDDDMVMMGKWYEFVVCYDVGFGDDGWIEGICIEFVLWCGVMVDLLLVINDCVMFYVDNCYYLFVVEIVSYWLKMYIVLNIVFCGFGGL